MKSSNRIGTSSLETVPYYSRKYFNRLIHLVINNEWQTSRSNVSRSCYLTWLITTVGIESWRDLLIRTNSGHVGLSVFDQRESSYGDVTDEAPTNSGQMPTDLTSVGLSFSLLEIKVCECVCIHFLSNYRLVRGIKWFRCYHHRSAWYDWKRPLEHGRGSSHITKQALWNKRQFNQRVYYVLQIG